MSDDDVLNREFLAQLQSGYRHVRKHRVHTLLDCAGADIFDAETRRRYLDTALGFDPKPMAVVLRNIFGAETSALADRIAATLYLHGADRGLWKMPSSVEKLARSLLAPKKEKPMKATKTRKTSFAARKDDEAGLTPSIAASVFEKAMQVRATTEKMSAAAFALWSQNQKVLFERAAKSPERAAALNKYLELGLAGTTKNVEFALNLQKAPAMRDAIVRMNLALHFERQSLRAGMK